MSVQAIKVTQARLKKEKDLFNNETFIVKVYKHHLNLSDS